MKYTHTADSVNMQHKLGNTASAVVAIKFQAESHGKQTAQKSNRNFTYSQFQISDEREEVSSRYDSWMVKSVKEEAEEESYQHECADDR